MIKISKFGGTSLADATNMLKSAEIIKSDNARKFIVVSAPGLRWAGDEKITDLLYKCAECSRSDNSLFSAIEARFVEIAHKTCGLDLVRDIKDELEMISQNIRAGAQLEYIVSRGEYLCARIFSRILGYDFIDAAHLVRFNNDKFDPILTRQIMSERLKESAPVVIPGFYGSDMNGDIKVFSRGGSDYTGAIVADAVKADLYENWTDVDGFRATDPKIIKDAIRISQLSYDEVYRLASMGASVLHPSTVVPLKNHAIKLVVKNTFNPSGEGTLISPLSAERSQQLAGIAVKKDCSLLFIGQHGESPPKAESLAGLMDALSCLNISSELISTDPCSIRLVLNKKLAQSELSVLTKKLPKCDIKAKNLIILALVGYRGNDLLLRASATIEKTALISYIAYESGGDLIVGLGSDSDINSTLTNLYNEFFQS